MIVRGKKAAPRRKMPDGQATPKPPANEVRLPAPKRGWVLSESLAAPQPGGALILDNWACTTSGIRPRGGCARVATLPAPVRSLFTYRTGNAEIMFGATNSKIYQVSGLVDVDNEPAAAVTGQTSGRYSTEQFGTAGGDYMLVLNGEDDAQLFDGATWSLTTITGVDTSLLSSVWSYANRVFFVEKDTMVSHYLPVDSIGGAVSQFSLAGVFKRGGALLFGGTWSLDAGDGLDDKCVFVSSEGEVAIYEGTNPGNASDWRLAGVYQISRPLGQNAIMQAGGDLLVATEIGLVPLSAAIQKDLGALDLASVSAPISPYWQDQARKLSEPWEIVKCPQRNAMIISQPTGVGANGSCLVANLQTGAWSRFTGWNTNCLGYLGDEGYFGSANGGVFLMEATGSDDGTPYTAVYLGQHESFGTNGKQITVHQSRAIFQTRSPINPLVSAQVDFSTDKSPPPNSPADAEAAVWGSAIWGQSTWGAQGEVANLSQWVSVGRTGFTIAPEVQLTFGVTQAPDVEMAALDLTFTVGAAVT